MPITIQHTPATLVGTLAAQTGIAQGQLRERGRLDQIQEIRTQQYIRQREQESLALERAQQRQIAVQERAFDRMTRQQELQMGRDMQLTQMMMQAQERGASEAAARVAQREAFQLQSALAAQRARVAPGKTETQDRRRQMKKAIADAKRAGIYDPRQIKQMEIMADLGDEKSFREVVRTLPKPKKAAVTTQRERALMRQAATVKGFAKQQIGELQRQINFVNEQLSFGGRYDAQGIAFMEAHPDFVPETDQEQFKVLLAQRKRLEDQIGRISQEASSRGKMLERGMTIPEQLEREDEQKEALQRLTIQAVDRQGRLTETQELAVSVAREKYRGLRKRLDSEIGRLTKELQPFEDEDPDDDEYLERIKSISAQIDTNRKLLYRTYAQEKQELGQLLTQDVPAPPDVQKTFTDSAGQKWEFVRYKANGQPGYRKVR